MLRSITLLLLFAGIACGLHAQNFQWAKPVNGTNDDRTHGIAYDAQGNVVVIGTFNGTCDFDPGPGNFTLTSAGGSDVYVLKLNAIGSFVWAVQIGGIQSDYGQGVAVDPSGNILVTGYGFATMDLDPGPAVYNYTPVGSMDIYIVKLNANGGFVWGKGIGGSNIDQAWAITTDTNGDIYTVGNFDYTVDFDPGPGIVNMVANGTLSDVFLLKLAANGNYLWAKRFGGSLSEFCYAVAVTSIGDIFLSGQFEGTADFDPGPGTVNLVATIGQPDVFVLKLNSSASYAWAKGIGSTSSETAHGVGVDPSGNVYCLGNFLSTVDFDPGAGTANMTAPPGAQDVFILKLSTAGNYVWAKQITGAASEFERSMAITPSAVYYTGHILGTADFNPGAAVNNMNLVGTVDAYIGKLDLNGNYVAAMQLAGPSSTAYGYHIKADPLGNVYTAGYFQGTVDFNPSGGVSNLTSSPLPDGFVHKLSLCTANSSSATASACGSYLFQGQTYTTSGTYIAHLPNITGCDSAITLNLTIRQPTTATINQNVCGTSFTLNSQTYTASGTYIQHLTNLAGCDSAITLNLSLRQPTTATINQNVCGTSYTFNSQTYTASGTYQQMLTNTFGCDSIITLNLTLRQPTTATINQNLCGTSYTLNSQTYNSSGTYVQHLTNTVGCDSAITLNLILRQPTASTLTQIVCGTSFTLNSQTYTASGTFTQTLTNTAGCDSVLTLLLTLNQPTTATLTQTACSSFTLNSQTYTASGTYTQTLTNTAGCDSTITLLLTVNQPTAATLTQTACSSFTLNSQTYTASGTYTQTLTNTAGCDSTITLLLTVNQPTAATLTQTACNSFTLNSQTYTASGTYTQTLTNTAGCDSTLTLILTLTSSPLATIIQGSGTLTASPTGLIYQWLDCNNSMAAISGANGQAYTPPATGNYAVIVMDGPCADTSACASFTVVGITSGMARSLVIYPNPNAGSFTIQLPAPSAATVEITDMLGKTILHQSFPSGQVLPIRFEASAGVYSIRIVTEAVCETRTLIRR